MPFLSLSLANFRNLNNSTLDISAKEIFFVGENGQGKSNLLESLYFASYASSFRTHTDSEIATYGQKDFSVRTQFKDSDGKTSIVGIYFKDGKKKIERNGKAVKDRKELVNTIPCVLFCHGDMEFASGEPERRRFFIDQSLTMHDSLYIDTMRCYKKVLKSRNIVLKEQKTQVLEALDLQLIENGLEIQKKRKELVHFFDLYFSDLYREISGIENVHIVYVPSWKAETSVEILEILSQKKEIDLQMGTTMSGPHRDNIRFIKDGKPFVPGASTGQRRLLSILLRIMQSKYYMEQTHKKPVLLMDDVLLELDPEKRKKVTALLPDYDQLFCTFLPGEPYDRYKRFSTRIYFIENGSWHD